MKTEKEIRDEIRKVDDRMDELFENYKSGIVDEEGLKWQRVALCSAKNALEWALHKSEKE